MPRTIAAVAALVGRLPAEQAAIWALVVAAVEESTAEANREAKDRLDRVVSCFGLNPLDITTYLRREPE